MDIEQRLRGSLAARDPGEAFDDAVMARLARQQATPGVQPARRSWRVPVALAATVLAAAFGLHWYSVQQREAHAREQLMLALQITSYELNQVQRRLARTETQEDGT
jgi:hypothetical protein